MSELLPVASSFLHIPAADGRMLAARMWRPTVPGRFPAILEFSPYRVFDMFRSLGDATFPGWARRGYVVIALDIAGSGGSTGLLDDEYLQSEIDDAHVVMNWCLAQNWCDGAIGLTGGSWPAFTALRLSDRKPAGLKAMVLGGVSENGWRTDIHYLGGISYAAHVDWAGVMQMFNALPPDPLQYGEGWRAAWLARLENNRPWIVPWLRHPSHDAFWQGKDSNLSSDVPLLLYGGFADKYTTAILRIAGQWQGPVRTILGPWEHMFPNLATRRPRIDFVEEALRWWDRWLKGRDTGVSNDPPLRCWVGMPDNLGKVESGQWRGAAWPPDPKNTLHFAERNGLLVEDGQADARWQTLHIDLPWPSTLGPDLYEDVPAAIDLGAFGRSGALIATAGARSDHLDIVGQPALTCIARGNGSGGQLVARLVDELPSGITIRMALTATDLGVLKPGEERAVEVAFPAVAWRVRKGHQLALVLCGDGSPTLWPAPRDAAIEVKTVCLTLPFLKERREVAFAALAPQLRDDGFAKLKWIDREDEAIAFAPLAGAIRREALSAAYHLPATGTDYFIASRFEFQRVGERQAHAAKSYRIALERAGFSIRINTRLDVSSTSERYDITCSHEAHEAGKLVHASEGKSEVPR